MSPTSNNARLLENYAGLQESRMNDLQSLVNKFGEYEVSGHSNALPSLSKIVKHWHDNGQTITTLEQLEYRAIEWHKINKTKPGFECLHIALARRQGQNIYIDGKYPGLLLDWVFYGPDVTLILGNGDYVYVQKTVEEMIDWLFSVSGVEREG
ncbi:hypothetical protein AJ79_08679 [Helicocarpus griseus UAMH5409]|uniref:Uncharacterized protein n=1 Tax=Helicocarpus griseus UAMH5409 TaxID=1447875 RepID=A0A2B7WQT4_9EURO|nr:hypothetical protein AJ79_08679 [Helicocarpus griseus UAMH5409]